MKVAVYSITLFSRPFFYSNAVLAQNLLLWHVPMALVYPNFVAIAGSDNFFSFHWLVTKEPTV